MCINDHNYCKTVGPILVLDYEYQYYTFHSGIFDCADIVQVIFSISYLRGLVSVMHKTYVSFIP